MSDGKKGTPVWVWIVALVGAAFVGLMVLVPFAIYGLRKYIASAKAAEANRALVTWGDGMVRCAKRLGQLPPSSSPVPGALSMVSARKHQSSPLDWSEQAFACAEFSLSEPQYFQYSWQRVSPQLGVMRAQADFDGDGAVDHGVELRVTCDGVACSPGAVSDGSQSPPAAASEKGPPGPAPLPPHADLSTVMGRARRLANDWQPEAALLGIEATYEGGRLVAQDGTFARLTFGPSPFAASPNLSGLFVVVYDQRGLSGAAGEGAPSKALPEPMCAPEHVLPRLTDLGPGPIVLRYALDEAERALWQASPVRDPGTLRLVDAQDCHLRGLLKPPGQH